MLLTGSGDELCGLLSALFQAVAYHLPTVGPSPFPVSLCLLKVWAEISSLTPPPHAFFGALTAPHPLCCIFSAPCLFFRFCSFCGAEGQSVQGLCWFIPGLTVGILCCRLFAYLLVCWISPKQVWSQHLAVQEPSFFSQCNVVWRSFVQAWGSVCRSPDSSFCFLICQVWLQHLSKIFDLQSSCCLFL
jgi:hypothetical protein